MRRNGYLILVMLLSSLLVQTAFADPGQMLSRQAPDKPASVVMPNVPEPRQGGDTIETATVIPSIPYSFSGTTTGFNNDYDAECPYDGSVAPDVVYTYTASHDMLLTVDLCGSSYDTKVYIYDEGLGLVACNDDFYFEPPCGVYVSKIEGAELTMGATYYIVIDGYDQDHGSYEMALEEYVPCVLECPPGAVLEGEPPPQDEYEDTFNCGCSCLGSMMFTDLVGDPDGETTLCGVSGWYSYQGSAYRESDWLTAIVGETGVVHLELDAEFGTYLFHILPTDCSLMEVDQNVLAGPCSVATMDIVAEPSSLIWIWIGPSTFFPPVGESPLAYDYVLQASGLLPGTIGTESASWSQVKSMYR